MRSKNILSVAAFIVAFAASAAFASLFITNQPIETNYVSITESKSTSCFKYKNNSATANKISALLLQDENYGREREIKLKKLNEDEFSISDSSAFDRYAKVTEEYAAAANSLDVSDLPSDFQILWFDHMKAWRDYSEFLNKSSVGRTGSVEEFRAAGRRFNRDIDQTFRKVQRSGASYGAQVDF